MRGGETANPISIKFCRVVDITDVITYANFGEDRLRSLGVVGVNALDHSLPRTDRRSNTITACILSLLLTVLAAFLCVMHYNR